ncbi:NAD(P)-binding protein [Trametes coccinea BRFM310]|uniref:NAD(P)-binding protein n=1 Tax=Trametes coccinea (strain BRFM310) TaxID=1353009 RepID=A0A1Y2IZF8_TRAC3|nr:NAD(P)-binding protein [Trametes coccinea BRFM310]
MKVLILGATGFIGLPVAQAFVRAGHVVYGQTRSATKSMQLAAEEIIPVVADLNETAKYLSLVASVDAVIDAVGGTNLSTFSKFLLDAIAEAIQAHRPPSAPKLTYIHTSGTWVHGENRSDVVGDTSPLGDTPALVAWRPAQEQRVITNPLLNGIVIRPALLYGRSASLMAPYFRKAYEGQVQWPGTPGGRLALIHCDDLAELYLLAAEKAAIAGGKIFDVANDVTESTDAFLQRLVEVSGGTKPYVYTEPANVFEATLNTTTIIRPYLGRALLGWRPRKAGLLDHMHIYYNAWKASEGLP